MRGACATKGHRRRSRTRQMLSIASDTRRQGGAGSEPHQQLDKVVASRAPTKATPSRSGLRQSGRTFADEPSGSRTEPLTVFTDLSLHNRARDRIALWGSNGPANRRDAHALDRSRQRTRTKTPGRHRYFAQDRPAPRPALPSQLSPRGPRRHGPAIRNISALSFSETRLQKLRVVARADVAPGRAFCAPVAHAAATIRPTTSI